MTESSITLRPAPRWLHALAVFATAWTVMLLVVGQLVTTFRAGMADPIWPTEPWYIFASDDPDVRDRYAIDFGFFVEHNHRMIGYVLGALASLLALGLWWTEPRKVPRLLGMLCIIVLLVAYGDFHRRMMAQREAQTFVLPSAALGMIIIAFSLVGLIAITGMSARVRGSGLRLLGLIVLAAVMVQGLLGGFRVRLNELVGTDLAAVHGVFAQIVFSLLVSLCMLTAARRVWPIALDAIRLRLKWYAIALIGLVLIQLVWGALIRHSPTPLTQRLHLLTAFAVLGMSVWMLHATLSTPEGRYAIGPAGLWLAGFLVLQITLGVEAWMGKFGTGMLPDLQIITTREATVRTLHTLIGTGILATSVIIALRASLGVPRSAEGSLSGSRTSRMPRPVLAGEPGVTA